MDMAGNEKREKVDHEGVLIQEFLKTIQPDEEYGFEVALSSGRDSKTRADVEYLSNGGDYLVLEAKTNESKDAYNTRHKIFGQLMKEHSKSNSERILHIERIALGVIIPMDPPVSGLSNTKKNGFDFYHAGYRDIPPEIFSEFGKLVKVKYVFVCSLEKRTVHVYDWMGYYYRAAPLKIVYALP